MNTQNATTTATATVPVVNRPPPKKPTKRPKVLVKLFPDGHVAAYAEKDVDVCIVNVVADTFPEDEAIVQQELGTMPKVYESLDWPNNVRARGNVQQITYWDVGETRANMNLVKMLNQLKKPPDNSGGLVSREASETTRKRQQHKEL